VVSWACPDGIGENLVEFDNWTFLHVSKFDENPDIGKKSVPN